MDSLIRETNENLKAIIDTMKANLDNSINTLENIQMQMDKKVEEAKKYKIQVDSAKDIIKGLEEDNKSLELSLKELNDKYGKMNLVSVIEAGNREIKTKINDNNREINKQKEHIADLTNKARTIKDLLMNLKKDKTIKEERLENLKAVYEYYNERVNEIVDYAFNHSENLSDYKNSYKYVDNYEDIDEEVVNTELENTMVFDEIANIDDNKNFKDEMTFINSQIDDTFNDADKIDEIIKKSLEKYNVEDEVVEPEIEEVVVNDDQIDSTQVFDSIFDEEEIAETVESEENLDEEDNSDLNFINSDLFKTSNEETTEYEKEQVEDALDNETPLKNEEFVDKTEIEDNLANLNLFINNEEVEDTENVVQEVDDETDNQLNNLDIFNISDDKLENDLTLDDEDDGEDRLSKINDLFSSIDNTNTTNISINNEPIHIKGIENQIDNAYMDVFGKPLEEKDLNKTTTLTDIFGNPIKKEELSEDIKIGKKIEELFVENGIDFNKFKEDEQSYLKQIYDEEKFNNILNTLKRNKINLDNLYTSFNVFGEISANELENLISKLLNCGQSVEAIGLVLEKLPKVKKYNIDEAIISYGDYIKDIDITELIMKAKGLYDGGNN